MKKISTIILVFSLLSLIFLTSCIIENPSDTQSTSPGNQDSNQQSEKLIVNHNTQDKDIYKEYKLGSYYGRDLNDALNVVVVGLAEYKIIRDYENAKAMTEYGAMLDKAIFEDNYILAVACLYSYDKAGLIGFKDLKKADNQPTVTLLNNGDKIVDNSKIYYLSVPKALVHDWADTGSIRIKKESADYVKTKQISVDNDFRHLDALTDLMSREEILEYIEKRNLPIKPEELQTAPSYLVCFSRNKFDNILSFSSPIISGNTVTISRDYNLSDDREERAFLNIIPIDVENVDKIKTVNLNSYVIENGTLKLNDYKIDNTVSTYDSVDFYKTFRGGVYYGTELAEIQQSSYTVIETYRELLDKAEFYIDEEIFKDNYVLVLKLVGVNPQRIGFANASVVWEDTTDGQGSCSLEIELYLSPYYESILNGDIEDLKEVIEEFSKNSVEYEYIVVPKAHLRNVRKTGDLNIYTNTTFYNYYEQSASMKNFDNTNYALSPGDTWQVTTKLEMEDFNKKFGTSFSTSYLGNNYGREYIIVYLEDLYEYEIYQSATRETDTIFYLSFLVGQGEKLTDKRGYFLCITKDSSNTEKQIIVEKTIISHGSYPSYSIEQNISSYDFYEMEHTKETDWKFKLITDYAQFEEIFNTYKHYEIEDNITADMIFDATTFENNYIVAVCITEGGSAYIKDGFYNARIGGNKVLYLYTYDTSSGWGDDALHDFIYFISIPKAEISAEIKGVKLQYTKEPVYNGPFENVIIASQNQEEVKLDSSHLIISSYDELKALVADYENYSKLQNIDFESNIVLAFNRHYYTTSAYSYGDFVNFKTSAHKTASITFMSEKNQWISNNTRTYILDLVIIPKEYLKHEIKYFYVRYETYSEPFEPDGLDRIEYPDILE